MVGDVGGSPCSPQQTERSQQREGDHAQRCAHGRDFCAAQRHVHRLAPLGQLGDEAGHAWVFRDVFVEEAVFCLADHAVVALGHDLVVVHDDQAGLALVFKEDVQVLANTFGLDVIGAHGLFAANLLQFVFGPRLRLDAHRLAFVTRALLDVDGLLVLGFACVDEDFVWFGHGVLRGVRLKGDSGCRAGYTE